jgi:YHS domain-containing protein
MRLVCAALAFLLAGCAVYPTAREGGADVNLRGYDPVAYFSQGRPVRGEARYESALPGRSYRFASAEHKRLFDADPQKYEPQYGGWCAHGMAYAVKHGSDPEWFRIVEGRLFIYGDEEGHDFAGMRLAFHIERADYYWRTEAKDAPRGWQYVKRIWFDRVPHYRKGTELEAEWLKLHPDRPHKMFQGRG